MDGTGEWPAVSFTRLFMARLDREVGRAFVIDPDDMAPRDGDECTTFLVLDANRQVFEVCVWECTELSTKRIVMEEAFGDPGKVALEPEVLAQFGGRVVDQSWFDDLTYTGVVFESLMSLTEWAHVFQMEENVTIVGTPRLDGPVSVNVGRRRD